MKMFLSGLALVAAFSALSGTSNAATQQTNITRNTLMRNADVVADAAARAEDSERERVRFRGVLNRARVSAAAYVNGAQLFGLGFKQIPTTANGLLVRTEVVDATCLWRGYYVYDAQTHFIKYEMERCELPKSASSSLRRRPH